MWLGYTSRQNISKTCPFSKFRIYCGCRDTVEILSKLRKVQQMDADLEAAHQLLCGTDPVGLART